jgi:hypothetical protein
LGERHDVNSNHAAAALPRGRRYARDPTGPTNGGSQNRCCGRPALGAALRPLQQELEAQISPDGTWLAILHRCSKFSLRTIKQDLPMQSSRRFAFLAIPISTLLASGLEAQAQLNTNDPSTLLAAWAEAYSSMNALPIAALYTDEAVMSLAVV